MQSNLFKQYEGVFAEKDTPTPDKKTAPHYAYSPFALQDAIGERNIKKVWIEYQKIILQGVEEEEIIHRIISKVRDMAAISAGASATDLGAKDYPFNKSKRDLKNWKIEDLKIFYEKLVSIYHQSRMTAGESLEIALEKVLLSL